ncbi:DNA polymeras-like protein zeta catalytic subunit [Calycina marina]|uniref:DNA polymerase n=1 Tax=Calycina marina TaxID=1763456 RepID=A0A9P7Z936_9HELO|nr:DNA polymeras-like protein zeta catalytic subunit [Calycina marina]
MDLFRVRLNCIDNYHAISTRFDPLLRSNVQLSQLQKEPKVPVIRVFGATETGQKVCAHVHGAFPYLYVEYTGSLIPDDVGSYIHKLHLSIDFALAVSYRRIVYDGKAKFVARITLVKGTPFYGFHIGYKHYLKIYMLNPMVMTRLGDLLRQGVIMKQVFQPYEAHLQYILQWMADYNLYGCGYIDCKKVSFRSPLPKCEDITNLSHLWHDRSVPSAATTDDENLPRVSHCSIEVDICVQDILNRNEIKPRPLHHDFIERLSPFAPGEKLVHSMAGLWRDETRRRKSKMSNPEPGSSPFPAEVMISMSADPRNTQVGGWIHEEEYREQVADLIRDEKNKSDGAKISFKSFTKFTPFETSVKTSFESVEDLFPENLRPVLGLQDGTALNYDMEDNEAREVDEARIRGFGPNDKDDDDYFYDSDEEVMRHIELSQRKKGDQKEEKFIEPVEEENIGNSGESGVNMKPGEDSHEKETNAESTSIANNISDSGYIFGPSAVGHPQSLSGSLKRPHSTVQPSSYTKRQRLDRIHLDPDSLSDSDEEGGVVAATNGSHQTKEARPLKAKGATVNGVSRYSTASILKDPQQESPKANDISLKQPFSYTIVKDPNDPDTKIRSSQITHVSFGPFTKSHNIEDLMTSESPSSLASNSCISPKIESSMRRTFYPATGTVLILADKPPCSSEVVTTMTQFHLHQAIYQDAFYSKDVDVPERAREWAGREFKLESLSVPFLPDFDPTGTSPATFGEKSGILPDKAKGERLYESKRKNCTHRSWEIMEVPPSYSEVAEWLRKQQTEKAADSNKPFLLLQPFPSPRKKAGLSQIEGPTQKNKHGFKYTQNDGATSVQHEVQYMSTMSLELHVNTRGSLVPNPEEDEVQCLFWCLQSSEDDLISNGVVDGTHVGVVALSEDGIMSRKITQQVDCEVQEETLELDLMIRMVEIVRSYDPDILTGYEVHGGSWGYLIERARLKYDYNLCDEFSRMKTQSNGRFGKDSDKWGFNNTSTIRVTGRHVVNIWRAMRGELTLLQYTMENVAFHLLHYRIPHFSWSVLTKWYTSGTPRDLAKLLNHYISRVQLNLELLEKNELISRTSEQARLLGVDFFSVFSRGSQFKVESLMFRIAKPESFMLVSPSRKQVGGQNALECLPLVMEPQSAFYSSPLLVLDFQSLYPSVMIAYNYCYSTFLGRVVHWRGTNKMGFTEYKRQQRMLELLEDHINIAPNGIMYTKPEIRKSLLAKMLGEILETRVMVKNGMKIDKNDKALQRLLNNRQLALKLIANVTYGYTSASFSGRMPCSEIADSIVQTGRETLEKSIALIHSVKRWGAEVVYGDTDSLFISLKGRTKDEAFDIGEEIAKAVTNMNPRPIKLKFEKVYHPCILLAKKRYVGLKYDHRNQTEPDFDAKGIETVRRDGTPAEQMIEEKALEILFRTSDLSQVKAYFQNQCEKIMKGSVSVQDFCFAKEVKLGTYSDKVPPPPGAMISTKRILEDARAEPQYGERVPYVVITGAPGARLIDRCVPPEELLESEHSELDAEYYISKNLIPPLERIFNLVGANVRNWYDEMPKVQRIRKVDANLQLLGQSKDTAGNKKTLESYMKSSSCLVCREKLETESPICTNCLMDKPRSLLALRTRLNREERKSLNIMRVCQSCSGISPLDEVRCDSKDCPVFYTRTKQKARWRRVRAVTEPAIHELSSRSSSVDTLEW